MGGFEAVGDGGAYVALREMRKKQIPGGNDRKKSKGNGKGNSRLPAGNDRKRSKGKYKSGSFALLRTTIISYLDENNADWENWECGLR
jgi:hypothetical protein